MRRFLSVEVKRMLISFAQLPNSKFNYFDGEGNMQEITTEALCKGKKVWSSVLVDCEPQEQNALNHP